jgi:hypothetical protein
MHRQVCCPCWLAQYFTQLHLCSRLVNAIWMIQYGVQTRLSEGYVFYVQNALHLCTSADVIHRLCTKRSTVMHICHSVASSMHKLIFDSYISKLEYVNKKSYTYFFVASRFLRLTCVLLQYNLLVYKLTSQTRSLCKNLLSCPLRFLTVAI